MENRLLCICFVQKVIFLDEFTDTQYKMTRILFVYHKSLFFVAQITGTRGAFICAQLEVYEYTNRILCR